MKIDNEFAVGVPIDRAWAVLTDLEGVAPSLPGAQLTGVDGDVYTVKIKVGPVVSVNTELNITGKIAQFGSGMIKEVSAKLLGQFAQNLEAKLLIPAASNPMPDGVAASPWPANAAAERRMEPARQVITAPPTGYRAIEADVALLDLMAVTGSSVCNRVVPAASVAQAVTMLGVHFAVR
jgi:uncharacterized protein